ncbi:MAG: hypothetical protein Q9160_008812 [Pyrenula sp. 1 TL-2023]
MDCYFPFAGETSMIESLRRVRSSQMSRIIHSHRSKVPANQLRLLRPVALDSNTLCFRSKIVPRAAAPPYTAVSYTWGDEEATKVIYLDDREFHVRPNLWFCLYHLSIAEDKSEWDYLWVDAISIDQSNEAERNAQVSLMDQTYKNSTCVSVWLGPANEDWLDWDRSWIDGADRPYWTRVWVIQEFLLGTKVEMFYGNHRLDWEHFRTLICREGGNSPYSIEPENTDTYGALPLLLERHHEKYPKFPQPLYSLLIEHHRSKCKDPRDRVFAFLGLISPIERKFLSRYFPDYTLKEDHVIIITLAHLRLATPRLAPQVWVDISSKNEKLFLGLGVESRARRKQLLRRANRFYYTSDDSRTIDCAQHFACDDAVEQFMGTHSEDPDELGEVESSNVRKTGRNLVLVGLALGLGVLLYCKRRWEAS